ncbi:hypothetical protein [Desulfobacula sp.]|uniref:hypothetical protein n=1 Tax=Desulfobacula sp. TaxID=2593537 RepID=UPI001EB1AA56|nr:hypothetical protein [Desulfobacula sp.]
MNKIKDLYKKRIPLLVSCILFVVVQVAFAGCSGSYGRLKPSLEIEKMFEEHKVLADHSYYFSGSDVNPNAVIGIDNNYTLNSKLWKPVNPTSEQLKDWIDNMTHYRGYALTNYGSVILDSTGKRLGVWYSPWNWTTVKMESAKSIVVHTPDMNPPRRTSGSFWGTLGEN